MSEQSSDRTVAREWARGWSVVLVGVAGMALTGISVYSAGLLMAPLEHEFGWNRKEISSGLLVWSAVSLVALPIMGRAIDRLGRRRVALPGVLLAGLLFGCLGLANGSLPLWWASWAVFAIAFAATNPAIWASAVSNIFSAGRGLAIGVMMCGSAVGAATIPLVTRWAIDNFGWRYAFPILGAVYSLLTFVLALAFLDNGKPVEVVSDAAPQMPGLEFSAAIRDPSVLKVLAAIFLGLVLIVGQVVHLTPMLIEGGIARGSAAALISGVGLGSVVGKIGVGWITDRSGSRIVPGLCFALPAVTCMLLLNLSGSFAFALAAVVVLGLGSGSLLQLSAYLISRYAGLRSFGQVYSVAAALMGATSGLGPMIAAAVFDRSGSYVPLLQGSIIVALGVGLMVGTLKAYPIFANVDGGAGVQARVAIEA
jgi:MFS family permease